MLKGDGGETLISRTQQQDEGQERKQTTYFPFLLESQGTSYLFISVHSGVNTLSTLPTMQLQWKSQGSSEWGRNGGGCPRTTAWKLTFYPNRVNKGTNTHLHKTKGGGREENR